MYGQKKTKMREELARVVLWSSLWPCGQRCVWPEIAEHADSDPRRWQPGHVSYCYFASTTTTCLLPAAHLSITSHLSSICVQDTSPPALRHLNESSRPLPFSSMPSSFILSLFIRSYHSLLACHTCPRTRSVDPPELSLSLSTNRHWRSL